MKYIKIHYKKILPEKIRINIRFLIYKIISYRYRGNKVTCNCCNKKFNRFLPYGDREVKRLNAACPWCLSLERTRMLWSYLCKSTFLKNKNKILHFAPAKILENLLKNNPNIDYISADINPALAMDTVDITNIKYLSNSFDLIICGHVLSVVKEDKKALNELYRILKKGGTLILLEHIYTQYDTTFEDFSISNDNERTKFYGAPYLERCYGNDFKMRIKVTGFDVKELDYTKSLSKNEIVKFGLQNSGLLFLCKKNL